MRTKVVTDITAVTKRLGIPLSKWPGNCMMIAQACYDKGLVPKTSKVCYGMYHGPISPRSRFGERDFSHHAWIELPEFKIYDPTRWAFTDTEPEIWIGSGRHPDYDLGSCTLSPYSLAPAPAVSLPPLFKMTPQQMQTVKRLFPSVQPDGLDMGQWRWLAHQHPDKVGKDAAVIYKLLCRKGYSGIIPIDLKRYVLGVDYAKYKKP